MGQMAYSPGPNGLFPSPNDRAIVEGVLRRCGGAEVGVGGQPKRRLRAGALALTAVLIGLALAATLTQVLGIPSYAGLWLVTALAVGAVVALVYRARATGRKAAVDKQDVLAAGPAANVALPAEAARPRLMPDAQAIEAARAHALDIAARDPATAAVILREWLNSPTVSKPPGSLTNTA